MKIKPLKKKARSFIKILFGTLGVMMMSTVPVMADTVQDSQIVKGTEKLIQDVTTWLMVLAPIVGVLLVIYFFIRRSAADEIDQKKWNNRIVTVIVSVIGAVLASATLNLIIGYYV
ncbi:Mbov_0395 family pilin-like conjugal transfer protein [Fusibacter tunisiensis]|uniref:Purine-cytosine permease-like protein n=1 Tax=Fusibacter tunisiensis TaxID=1008308 RepID=A0ABS2MU22_9FIRM|nr:purine-cytosine permease-like protein [Fusibacter tunisiensis]